MTDHHHGHSHGILDAHDHTQALRGASKRNLTLALILIGGYMVVEIIGGVLSGSLALIADAGHMLTDAAAIGLALAAMHFATRAASARRTFGYHRLEILAALVNALALGGISVWVMIEAYHRFTRIPEVEGGLMLVVGSIGLVVNVAAARVLHRSVKHSINVEGAFQHVIADLLGSVAVVVSGLLIWAFGWHIADPILSVLIGILILFNTWRLLAKVVHILLEGAPEHIDLYALGNRIEMVEGVAGIHDVHCWTLAPGYDALSAHVTVEPGFRERAGHNDDLLNRLRDIAYNEFKIQHVTIQIEDSADNCNEDHQVGRPPAATAARPA